MGEKSDLKRTWKGGKKNIPFYIISTVVLFIFGILFIGYYSELWTIKKNVDFTQTVEATITDLSSYADSNLIIRYFLFYEYTSPDGIYYSGTTDSFYDRDEAMSHIGEKVQIYIDGNGNSAPSLAYSSAPNTWALIIGIILLVAGLAVFLILVIPHKWKRK